MSVKERFRGKMDNQQRIDRIIRLNGKPKKSGGVWTNEDVFRIVQDGFLSGHYDREVLEGVYDVMKLGNEGLRFRPEVQARIVGNQKRRPVPEVVGKKNPRRVGSFTKVLGGLGDLILRGLDYGAGWARTGLGNLGFDKILGVSESPQSQAPISEQLELAARGSAPTFLQKSQDSPGGSGARHGAAFVLDMITDPSILASGGTALAGRGALLSSKSPMVASTLKKSQDVLESVGIAYDKTLGKPSALVGDAISGAGRGLGYGIYQLGFPTSSQAETLFRHRVGGLGGQHGGMLGEGMSDQVQRRTSDLHRAKSGLLSDDRVTQGVGITPNEVNKLDDMIVSAIDSANRSRSHVHLPPIEQDVVRRIRPVPSKNLEYTDLTPTFNELQSSAKALEDVKSSVGTRRRLLDKQKKIVSKRIQPKNYKDFQKLTDDRLKDLEKQKVNLEDELSGLQMRNKGKPVTSRETNLKNKIIDKEREIKELLKGSKYRGDVQYERELKGAKKLEDDYLQLGNQQRMAEKRLSKAQMDFAKAQAKNDAIAKERASFANNLKTKIKDGKISAKSWDKSIDTLRNDLLKNPIGTSVLLNRRESFSNIKESLRMKSLQSRENLLAKKLSRVKEIDPALEKSIRESFSFLPTKDITSLGKKLGDKVIRLDVGKLYKNLRKDLDQFLSIREGKVLSEGNIFHGYGGFTSSWLREHLVLPVVTSVGLSLSNKEMNRLTQLLSLNLLRYSGEGRRNEEKKRVRPLSSRYNKRPSGNIGGRPYVGERRF